MLIDPKPIQDPKPAMPAVDPKPMPVTASKKVDDLSKHESKHDIKHDAKPESKQMPGRAPDASQHPNAKPAPEKMRK